LFDSGKPIAYVATIPPDADFGEGRPGRKYENPELSGEGLRVISIFIDEEARGKGLAVALYHWLLTHACDYILPDDLQTRGGVFIWKQMLRDPRFEIMVFNHNTHEYYKPKPGAVWANTYKSYWLRPFVTLAGKADQLIDEGG
jgi:GNAT superfamily N-acetyltransferase